MLLHTRNESLDLAIWIGNPGCVRCSSDNRRNGNQAALTLRAITGNRGPFQRRGNWNSFGVAGAHAMKLPRRKFLHLAAGAATLPAVARFAMAQTYPDAAGAHHRRLCPRWRKRPDIPAVVPGYEAGGFVGIGAPRNTPAAIVEKLNKEINAALADPQMKARLADLGASVLPGSPADFGRLIADDTEKWAKVVKLSGAKPE